MAALDALDDWPVPAAAAAVVGPSGVLATHGDTERVFVLASVTKPLVARAAQIAVEENDVGRLPGYVRSVLERDADVGAGEGR